jgi:chromosome partitioning protein
MKIVTITNQKGGVGKTTVAINVSAALALREKKVLLIDLDPQGNATTFLNVSPAPGAYTLLASGIPNLAALMSGDPGRQIAGLVVTEARENLDVLPGNEQTAVAQTFMLQGERDIGLLRRAITAHFRHYDFVVLDTAPSVGGVLELAMWAADKVLLPASCETGSLDGLMQTINKLKALTNKGWQGQITGVVPTFLDERTTERRETLANYQSAFADACLPPIHESTAIRELPSNRMTVFEKAEVEGSKKTAARAAQEFEALARATLRR